VTGKAYAEYTDSDVEWIGTVPRHWTTKPLWSMFLREKDVDHPDEPMVSVYRDHGVIFKDSRDDNLNQTAENRSIYQLIGPGWLICNRMKAWQGSVGVSAIRGIVSGHYICFRPQHREDDRYLNWLFRSDVYTTGYRTISRGVRPGQAEIDNDDYRVLPVLLPPLDEQRAIAAYLDAETTKIDALIAKQEQLIETLRERRDAVVQDAIDGAQPVTVALKRRMVVTDCKHVTAEFVDDIEDSYPLASIRECQGPLLDLRNARRTTRAFFEVLRDGGRDPHPGDLVITRNASVGLVARVDRDTPDFAMGQDVCLLHPLAADLVDARYAQYVLLSHGATEQFELSMIGSTFRRINVDDIRGLRTKWPSGVAQQRIADHLDEQTAKIDGLIERTERFIELARERRAALITAAVTGQIDVRDGAA
jgi:type I restriction enzyme S subunit